jgi:hypothetical protein
MTEPDFDKNPVFRRSYYWASGGLLKKRFLDIAQKSGFSDDMGVRLYQYYILYQLTQTNDQ